MFEVETFKILQYNIICILQIGSRNVCSIQDFLSNFK